MDNMQYSWTSPQEDEFALLCMGAPSAYESLLVPSLMADPRICWIAGADRPKNKNAGSKRSTCFSAN